MNCVMFFKHSCYSFTLTLIAHFRVYWYVWTVVWAGTVKIPLDLFNLWTPLLMFASRAYAEKRKSCSEELCLRGHIRAPFRWSARPHRPEWHC